MIVFDACFACIGCAESHLPQDKKTAFDTFAHKLADEMIEWGGSVRHQRPSCCFPIDHTPRKHPIDVVHLTPAKRVKLHVTSPTGRAIKGVSRVKSHCKVCKTARSVWLCSHCDREAALCHHMNEGRDCFTVHCSEHHANETCSLPSHP